MDDAPAAPTPAAPPAAVPVPGAPAVRPTGVTVLAVLAFIGGALAVFAGFALMTAGAFLGAMGAGGEWSGLFAIFGAAAGVFLLVYAAFLVAVGVGLLKRMRWAWYASMVIAALQMLGGLGSLVGLDLVGAVVNLGIGAFVGWYLLSPPVQAWFGVAFNTPWRYKPAA